MKWAGAVRSSRTRGRPLAGAERELLEACAQTDLGEGENWNKIVREWYSRMVLSHGDAESPQREGSDVRFLDATVLGCHGDLQSECHASWPLHRRAGHCRGALLYRTHGAPCSP